MATFPVTGVWGANLANKARSWLGKTLDGDAAVAPVSYNYYDYDVEAQAHNSAENYRVILHAIYTVGPTIDGAGGDKLDEPLLLRANHTAPLHGQVKQVVEVHVRALAGGMTTEHIFVMGRSSFVNEVLDRVQPDLGECGLHVYSADVKGLVVKAPASKLALGRAAAEASKTAAGHTLEEALAGVEDVAAQMAVDNNRGKGDAKESLVKSITEGLSVTNRLS